MLLATLNDIARELGRKVFEALAAFRSRTARCWQTSGAIYTKFAPACQWEYRAYAKIESPLRGKSARILRTLWKSSSAAPFAATTT